MADSETQQPVDQQVTSQTPATKQKNPKRVAAGKVIAQKTKQAREAQSIIAAKNVDPLAEPVAETPQVESSKNVLTTTQWVSVISIIVSLAGGLLQTRRDQKRFYQKNSC